MCGIVAIFGYHPDAPPVNNAELVRIREAMFSRGPDGAGTWISSDQQIGLAHRRLAIIDPTDAGAQPMATADGRLRITFNGEIYNYRELRRTLEARGHNFVSESDTEVLLHLYLEYGEEMVRHLRGMYAFVIWDESRRAMFVARDPYGIKPLYYADDGRTVRIASQVKAVLAGGAVSRDPDPAGIVGFFLMGSVPEPHTTWLSIRGVPAGHTMRAGNSGVSAPRRFFSVGNVFCAAEQSRLFRLDAREAQQQIRAALLDSVRHHLVADVPVGVFLSAGLDSGTIVGLARDAGVQDLQTITLAFQELRGQHCDEAPLAEEVAAHYGIRHRTTVLTREEFGADVQQVFDAMDQPSIDGVNTYFVAKAAAGLGLKVALSGTGGDELFAGYPSFHSIPRAVRALSIPSLIPGLGRLVRAVGNSLVAANLPVNPKVAGLVEYGGSYSGAYLLRRGLFLPWELGAVMDRTFAHEGLLRLRILDDIENSESPTPRTSFARVATLEAERYMRNQLLRDSDWAGMANGLEIRVPLVDARLLEKLAPILVFSKEFRSKTMLGHSPSTLLPASVRMRRKSGFTVPIDRWLQDIHELEDWRNVSYLSRAWCPWARRWAYTVARRTFAKNAAYL